MDDLLHEFIAETVDNLELLDQQLLSLEKDPRNDDLIRTIFRILHTIKGTCGFLGIIRMEKVAHSSETVLGKMRDHQLSLTPEISSLLFESLDRIKEIVEAVQNGEDVTDISRDQPLIDQLLALCEVKQTVDDLQALFDSTPVDPNFFATQQTVEAPLNRNNELNNSPTQKKTPNSFELKKEPVVENRTEKSVPPPLVQNHVLQQTPVQESIRVNVDVLDNLIMLVSELVLSRNQLLQLSRINPNQTFGLALSRLSYITTELQEEVMKTRMQPIENAWTKFPRLIRDLSKDLSKKIILKQIGGDTEVDRQVLELIKDPLTHMIRNSCDHGIELPATRNVAGKLEEGTITLKAHHEGGHIVIEISDDGCGLNPEKLRKKTLEKGLFTELEINQMSDSQIQNIIFLPGFSTAQTVTSVSGRGVGMDVVKSNIQKLGGSINMTSIPGKGTQFIIKIPLTLTIISAIILESGKERFAIPQISVTELHRIGGRSQYHIEYINDTPVMRLRQKLLPLLFLSNYLDLESPSKLSNEEKYVVVTHIGNTAFGIIVDKIYDTQEIVVKPLSKLIQSIKVFSGSTILGDGSIVMILDPNILLSFLSSPNKSDVAQEKEIVAKKGNEESTLLLIFSSNNHLYTLPLSLISRIGEINYRDIDAIDNVFLTQYQNYLLPLVMFDGSEILLPCDEEDNKKLPVLIFSDNNRVVGLVVDEIITIEDEKIDIQINTKKNGLLGTCIMQEETVSIIDIEYYLVRIYPDWFDQVESERRFLKRKLRALLVDDSQFFRNLIIPVINIAGYDVITAPDATMALDLLKEENSFDVIISDIEMPGMNGFDFCKQLRMMDAYQKPFNIIALSSRVSEKDLTLGKEAGFSEYIAKNEQKKIIHILNDIRKSVLTGGDAQ